MGAHDVVEVAVRLGASGHGGRRGAIDDVGLVLCGLGDGFYALDVSRAFLHDSGSIQCTADVPISGRWAYAGLLQAGLAPAMLGLLDGLDGARHEGRVPGRIFVHVSLGDVWEAEVKDSGPDVVVVGHGSLTYAARLGRRRSVGEGRCSASEQASSARSEAGRCSSPMVTF